MPDIPDQEWQTWLSGEEPAATAAPNAPPSDWSLVPLAASELQRTVKRAQALELGRPRPVENLPGSLEDYATRMGARPGIPFDTTTGVPLFTKLKLDWQPTPKDKLKMLQDEYGADKVRTNKLGWPIVEMRDKEGRVKDVLAEPTDIDWQDTTGLLTQIPEMAGVLAALYATRGRTLAPGILNALKTLGLTVAGSAAGSAAKDIAVRSASGEPIDLPEIAGRRGAEAAVNTALGPIMGAAGYAAGRAISPFSQAGALQTKARVAREALLSKHGIDLEISPAEATGSPILSAVEALESQKPGSKTAFQKFQAKRREDIDALRNVIMGGAIPTEEEAGKKTLQTIGAKLAPAEFDIQRLASQTAAQAEREILSGVGAPINKVQLGAGARVMANVKRKAFQDESARLYGIVESNPLTQTKNIPMDDVAQSAGAMLAKQPSTIETVQAPTGLVGATGAPITKPTAVLNVVDEFMESGVVPKLRALSRMQDQPMRLEELMKMRHKIDQEIAIGEAVPGWKSGDLGEIRGLLTNKIKNGLRALDPNLLTQWEAANAHYAKGATSLERAGIAELFRDPRQPGYLTDEEVISRLSEGKKASGIYQAYRDFFGPTSGVMRGVRQSIRDDILKKSELSPSINARQFIDRLESLDTDAPEVLREAFGTANARNLRSAAWTKIASQLSDLDELPKAELDQILASGNLSAQSLTALRAAQDRQKEVFRNTLLKDIARGNVDGEKLKPHEVVSKFVFNKSTSPDDLRGLYNQLIDRPDVREDLRRLTFKRVLDDSTIVSPTGERVIGANKLEAILADENTAARLETVLGKPTFGDLTAIKDFLKPGAAVAISSRAAGQIGGASQIAQMVEKGDLSYVGRAIKNFIMATIYTDPKLSRWARNTALSADDKAMFVNALVTSTPFARKLASDFTDKGAKEAAMAINHGLALVNARQQTAPAVQPRITGNVSDADWNQWLKQSP